jgi:FixJ family two-component response regulator
LSPIRLDGDIGIRLRCISHRQELWGFVASCIQAREELELPNLDVAIVEDDESVREATDHLLRLLGYVTASFSSAEDFLNSGRVPDTACLITDVRLPGMSGVELQSRLILDGYRMPIIFVTAFPDETIRARVLKNGAIGYLSKPLREQSLIASLDQVFERPR